MSKGIIVWSDYNLHFGRRCLWHCTGVCIDISTVTDAVCNSDCDLEVSNIDAYCCACTIGGDKNLQYGYDANPDAVYRKPHKWNIASDFLFIINGLCRNCIILFVV